MPVSEVTAECVAHEMGCPKEFAIIDVREGRQFAAGHLSLSAHISLSFLEVQALRSVPRKTVPIILVDGRGETAGAAHAASEILADLGFTNLRVLAGGVEGWARQDRPLATGYNARVKTFADLAHAFYETPTIDVGRLKARLAERKPTTIIDCRPRSEYLKLSVSGAYNDPGVELALGDLGRRQDPDHLYVITCFSRTRGVVGATTLSRLNGQTQVAFLEDGVMSAFLEGLPTAPGNPDLPRLGHSLEETSLRRDATAIIKRHGFKVIDLVGYRDLERGSEGRSLYVFDIRPEEDFRAGHLRGAVSVPGGQLLMTYDVQVPVRNGRIVLVDDPHLKRAAILNFWLSHFDDAEIFILPVSQVSADLTRHPSPPILPDDVRWLGLREAAHRIEGGMQVWDVGPSLDYEQGHLPGARFVLRSSWSQQLEPDPGTRPVLFTSPDGLNAAYAASQANRRFGIDAYALKGGTESWRQAGLPVEDTFMPDQLLSDFDDDWGSTMRAKVDRERLFREYLTWEKALASKAASDEAMRFRWPAG